MGQRGWKKRRVRCHYVYPTGLRCPNQVKHYTCRFCCPEHAVLARPRKPPPEPGARTTWRLARQRALDRYTAQLRAVADDQSASP
jgi:hypothetical protein